MIARPAYGVALTALGAVCLLGIWRAAALVEVPVPLDPNEGWNAYHALAAMGAGPLYPGPHSYMVNNYPPLSFYIVGLLGRLMGDDICAGRLVSLISLGAVAAELYAIARRLGCARTPSVFAPLFLVAWFVVGSDYVGMDDPQMLAHAVAMAGFLILVNRRDRWALTGAALLFVIAFFVKHNVVAMPIAAAIWLLLRDRRAALRFVIAGLGFLIAGLVAFRMVYGTSLLARMAEARTYSFAGLHALLLAWLPVAGLPLAAAAVLTVRRRADFAVQLAVLYALVAVAIGVAFLGGAGVDVNVLFDADIALALCMALALDRLVGDWPAAAAVVCTMPLVYALWANDDARTPAYWFSPLRTETAEARADIAFLQHHKGPALCEMLSFCYWAGKSPSVDVFNTAQAFLTGTRSDTALVAEVEARRFAAIQLDPDDPDALGGNVAGALARSYRLDHADDLGVFYVPR